MAQYFVKQMKTETWLALIPHANELKIVTLAAQRANAGYEPRHGIPPGGALMGDWENLGMSRSQYRTACKNLVEWGHMTSKKTNRGTMLTFANADLYEIPAVPVNQQISHQENRPIATKTEDEKPRKHWLKRLLGRDESPTDRQQIANRSPTDRQQIATNKEVRGQKERKKNVDALTCALEIFSELITATEFESLGAVPKFRTVYEGWLEHRCEKNCAPTRSQIKLDLTDARDVGADEAMEMMAKARRQDYRGWYFKSETKRSRSAGPKRRSLEEIEESIRNTREGNL